MSNIQAVGTKVLVKPDPVESKTPGGIVMLEGTLNRPNTGIALSIGEDCKLRGVLQKGDKVYYEDFASYKIKDDDGEELVFLDESAIYGVRL